MGKIKIKEENKGKFTLWARNHGMSVQEAARKVLRNREKYSPALIKRANFARNASKWEDGGQFGLGGTMSSIGGVASAIPTPWTQVGGAALSLMGGLIGGGEQKDLLAEQVRQKAIGMADAGQAGILNNYPTTFKTGGMFKGKKFGGKPNAEVEGGEMLMTPDGVMTKMMGNSHAQGGMPVQLPTDTIILSKKNSKDMLPLTNKINKNKEIMEGGASKLTKNSAEKNLNKYYSKVLDRYNEQEAKKFAKGGQFKFDGGGDFYNPMFQNPVTEAQSLIDARNTYTGPWRKPVPGMPPNWGEPVPQNLPYPQNQVVPVANNLNGAGNAGGSPYNNPNFASGQTINPGFGVGYTSPSGGDLNLPYNPVDTPKQYNINFSNPQDDPNSASFNPAASKTGVAPKGNGSDWADLAGSIGEMAPMLYNLGQGLFGKREKTARNAYDNPNEGQVNSLMANRRYNIDAGLAQNEASYRTASANMRNLGGSRGQVMSNLTGAQNTKQFGDMALYGQKNNMENQYRGEQAGMLYGLGRDKSMSRMAIDEGNQMTDATGRNMIGAGMTGLQQYLLTRRQMKGQAKRDDMLLNAIKAYSPYSKAWLKLQD